MSLLVQFPISLTGVIALVVALGLTLGLARDNVTRAYYVGLLVVHLLGALGFYALTFRAPTDAHLYYAQSEWLRSFGIGTPFVSFLLGWVREFTDLTFLDSFLVFHIPGLVGIILLHRAAVRLAEQEFGTSVLILGVILLMPGLHLWTASVGKDSLVILAYGLISLALLRKDVDLVLLSCGLLLYFFVRPHIAFEIVAAMMLAFLPLFGHSPRRMQMIGVGSAVMFMLLLPYVFLFVGIDGNGTEGVRDFVENRQNRAFRGSTSFDLSTMNPAERFVTVMFRPLFFDARGIFGLVASIENLFLLTIFGYLAWNVRLIWRLMTRSAMLRFHVFFLIIFVAIFSQTTGNLGLALRHKIMIIPALFLILVTVIAYHNRRRQDRRAALKSDLLPAE